MKRIDETDRLSNVNVSVPNNYIPKCKRGIFFTCGWGVGNTTKILMQYFDLLSDCASAPPLYQGCKSIPRGDYYDPLQIFSFLLENIFNPTKKFGYLCCLRLLQRKQAARLSVSKSNSPWILSCLQIHME